MKIIDNFIWLIVTHKAHSIYKSGLFDLYILYPDGSEGLIESEDDLFKAIDRCRDIGIEVGQLTIKGE